MDGWMGGWVKVKVRTLVIAPLTGVKTRYQQRFYNLGSGS